MYKINNIDGLWIIEDELGSVIEVCETRAQARGVVAALSRKTETAPSVHEQLGDAVVDSIERMEAMPSPMGVVVDATTETAVIDTAPEGKQPESEEVSSVDDILKQLKRLEESAQLVMQPKTTVQVVKVEKRVTKASQVRARIAIAKQTAELPDVVVGWAVENLGMAKPLAKVYVKGNWDRVPN